jgi:hypothetical protein
VVGLALFCRLPVLLHPQITSDSAVVGLQALHMLRGEWSRFLWAAPYQSSLDPAVAALFTLVTGPRPLAVVLGPVLEQVALCWVAHRMLRRHIGDLPALVACLPLVLPLQPLSIMMSFAATRSGAGLIALGGVALADGGAPWRRAVGTALIVLAAGIDLYMVLLLPPLLLSVALEGPPRKLVGPLAAAALAAAAAFALHLGSQSFVLTPDPGRLARNWRLLWWECLPDAIGASWRTQHALPALRIAGAAAFSAGILSGGLLALRRDLPWGIRRLGLCGFLAALISIAGFLGSGLARDVFSSRYLVAILWTAPMALAPALHLLGARWSLTLLSPWLASAAVASALALGLPATLRPLPLDGLNAEDRALRDRLRELGVRGGAAQYWVAYRLTYLFEENPILVPLDASEGRYAPYIPLVSSESRLAFVFHPDEPRAQPGDVASRLRRQGLIPQTDRVGRYAVLLVDRPPPTR